MMMDTVSIRIKYFGAFRKLGRDITLDMPVGASVSQIKTALSENIKGKESLLVFDSVLGNDDAILPDSYQCNTNCELAILPPVCGG